MHIKIHGVPLEIEYDYEAGYAATEHEPGVGAYVEVTSVTAGGVDITDLLSGLGVMSQIDEFVLGWVRDDIKAEADQARADDAAYEREREL